MILRRIGGLAISVLLLQLNFASIDIACAKHSAQSPEAAHHGATSEPVNAEPMDHDHEPAGESEPCEIPAQKDCCQALVSCSMTLGLAASSQPTENASLHLAVANAAARAPAYLVRAPEPPPPKA